MAAGQVVGLIQDSSGNRLLDVRFVRESTVDSTVMSLVVVRHTDEVLLVFDRWRRQWELPGGVREPGETPREAAIRELAEETGISGTSLTFHAIADFALANPPHREQGAVYATDLTARPTLRVNEEVSAFRWWPPTSPITADQSPLDAEIARLVHSRDRH